MYERHPGIDVIDEFLLHNNKNNYFQIYLELNIIQKRMWKYT